MRTSLLTLALVGAVLTTSAANAQPLADARAPAAVSADHYGIQASYRSPAKSVGYSWQARRAADCLATYRASYDPRTNMVEVAPGIARRCDL